MNARQLDDIYPKSVYYYLLLCKLKMKTLYK